MKGFTVIKPYCKPVDFGLGSANLFYAIHMLYDIV